MTSPSTNPVGYLQEFCQKYKCAAIPRYEEVGSIGPDHAKQFTCKCRFDTFETLGKSNQKKQAKFEAAKAMVELLSENNYLDHKAVKDESPSRNVCNGSVSKNPISALQEYCQLKKLSLPIYFEHSTGGNFICECCVQKEKTYGNGPNKKSAKTESALKMCQKLNIIGASQYANIKNEEAEEDYPYSEKNAISALQELCAANTRLQTPEYIDEGIENSFFVVTCKVGEVSGVGKDITKKGAKVHAANKVLGKLLQEGYSLGLTNSVKKELRASSSDDEYRRPVPYSIINDLSHQLEEHNLNSYDANSNGSQENLSVEDTSSKDAEENRSSQCPESLSLDDSVVVVEPDVDSVNLVDSDSTALGGEDNFIHTKYERRGVKYPENNGETSSPTCATYNFHVHLSLPSPEFLRSNEQSDQDLHFYWDWSDISKSPPEPSSKNSFTIHACARISKEKTARSPSSTARQASHL